MGALGGGSSDMTISKEGCGESSTAFSLKTGWNIYLSFFVTIFKTLLNVHVQICFLLSQCWAAGLYLTVLQAAVPWCQAEHCSLCCREGLNTFQSCCRENNPFQLALAIPALASCTKEEKMGFTSHWLVLKRQWRQSNVECQLKFSPDLS